MRMNKECSAYSRPNALVAPLLLKKENNEEFNRGPRAFSDFKAPAARKPLSRVVKALWEAWGRDCPQL
jgi:hypothetical protein